MRSKNWGPLWALFGVWPAVAHWRRISEHRHCYKSYSPTNALSFEIHFILGFRVPLTKEAVFVRKSTPLLGLHFDMLLDPKVFCANCVFCGWMLQKKLKKNIFGLFQSSDGSAGNFNCDIRIQHQICNRKRIKNFDSKKFEKYDFFGCVQGGIEFLKFV